MIYVLLGYSFDRKQLFIIPKITSDIFVILAVLVNEFSRAMAF